MFHKCDHCDYESNRKYNTMRHEKKKHESHHPKDENQVNNDVSHERLSSSPTKINSTGCPKKMIHKISYLRN